VGSGANEVGKASAVKIAQAYIDQVADGRDAGSPIVRVSAGE